MMISDDFRLALIWLAGGSIATFAALAWLPSVFVNGEVLLTGHDSFYHGRRILDAVPAPLWLLQFDTRIEAPDGAWVPWPWGSTWRWRLLRVRSPRSPPLTIRLKS